MTCHDYNVIVYACLPFCIPMFQIRYVNNDSCSIFRQVLGLSGDMKIYNTMYHNYVICNLDNNAVSNLWSLCSIVARKCTNCYICWKSHNVRTLCTHLNVTTYWIAYELVMWWWTLNKSSRFSMQQMDQPCVPVLPSLTFCVIRKISKKIWKYHVTVVMNVQ